jgi:hypothetical protein
MSLRKTSLRLFLLACTGLTLASGCSSTHLQLADDVPHTAKPFVDQPENFQFVIVGDRTGGHRPGVFRLERDYVTMATTGGIWLSEGGGPSTMWHG